MTEKDAGNPTENQEITRKTQMKPTSSRYGTYEAL